MPRLARGRQPRIKTTGFGVTEAELGDLHTKAATAGYSTVGAWIRDVVFAVQVTPPPAQIDQDTNTQLRGIGSNLNQALRRINGGQGSADDWGLIREASRAVVMLRRKLVGQDPGVPVQDATAGIPPRVAAVSQVAPADSTKPGVWQV